MTLTLASTPVRLPDDREALIAFLTGDEWPFHVHVRPTHEQAAKAIDDGQYGGPAANGEAQAFWLDEGGERAGLVTLRELCDPTPIFDLRVCTPFRRRGVGRAALAWLAAHVFTTTDKLRLEGHTRGDNVAMRRTFRAAGWVKEAHHRRAWPDAWPATRWHDATTYAVLKDDWTRGTITPVPWDQDP
jgi:RimJ/RimL family protein N-acetyltransferase